MRLILVMLLAGASCFGASTHPESHIEIVTERIHGTEISDPYRWLENQNSPDTRAWIERQIEYANSVLPHAAQRDPILKRVMMNRRWRNAERGYAEPPLKVRGRYFFSLLGATPSSIYMRVGAIGEDELLVDPTQSERGKNAVVRVLAASEDGSLLLYALFRDGGRNTVTALDINNHRQNTVAMPETWRGNIYLTPDNRGFFYAASVQGKQAIFVHRLRSDSGADEAVFHDESWTPKTSLDLVGSEDSRYLAVVATTGAATKRSEVYIKDLRNDASFAPLVKGIDGVFMPRFAGDRMYLQTTWNAPNGRIVMTELAHPEQNRLREVVPESGNVLEAFSMAGGHIVTAYMENVVSRLKVFTPEGKPLPDIQLPILGTVSRLSGRWSDDECFFEFQSYATPSTLYRFVFSSRTREEWAHADAIDISAYEVKQVWCESRDKTKVPMFLVYKKGTTPDGARPTLLTGYGGFSVSMRPSYSVLPTTWMEMGGVFVMANLRGGGEFGEAWHQSGMLRDRQNVHDDFIAAAEWLIDNKYTNPSKLAIIGRSQGGLLVGVAATQRADLFQAVICNAPLLDMLRYDKFPPASSWVSEYGSSENPELFPYLLRYSPYHNVKKGVNYPAFLIAGGDGDNTHAPLHARKMAAALQNSTSSDRPIVLYYDKGSDPNFDMTPQSMADELAFLAAQLKM